MEGKNTLVFSSACEMVVGHSNIIGGEGGALGDLDGEAMVAMGRRKNR